MRGTASLLLVALVSSCGAPSPTPPPSAPIATARPIATPAPAPAPSTRDAARDDLVRGRADRASEQLASLLETTDTTCRESWPTDEEACKGHPLAGIATDYLAYYGDHEDPCRSEGRIDALPRIGAPSMPVETLTVRLEIACVERCGTARRASVARVTEGAVDECAGRASGHEACASLAHGRSGGQVRAVVESCEDACDQRRAEARQAAERERKRPRTRAQWGLCIRDCMRRCTGGRIVPASDGSYTKEPDDWCGTCDFTCQLQCAVP